MAKIFVFRRSTLVLFGVLFVAVILGSLYIKSYFSDEPVSAAASTSQYHIAIVEYEGKTPDGKEYEVYRFDPGTLYVQHGQQVTLTFHGVHGLHHPFVIEGYNIQGTVSKGESKSVSFTADREGTFRIICTAHDEHSNHVPMIGYLVVD